MPELAEAEFFRKRWHQAALRSTTILRVHTHDAKKIFRTAPAAALRTLGAARVHRAALP